MIKRVKLINIQATLFFFFLTNVNVQYITATILIKTFFYIFEVACSKKFEFFIRDEKNLLITNM